MRKHKLEFIEAYIYAKTLYLICENTKTTGQIKCIKDAVIRANEMSHELLVSCEKKIKVLKLFTPSFLLLKKELEDNTIYQNDTIVNYTKICEMIKHYDKYLKLVS